MKKEVKIIVIALLIAIISTSFTSYATELPISISDNQYDIDGDGILNKYDTDIDGDGIGNIFDKDADGDAILNKEDATPFGTLSEIPKAPEKDTDEDGIPDIYEWDIDSDGISNIFDKDIDGDGILNNQDATPQG